VPYAPILAGQTCITTFESVADAFYMHLRY